MVDRRRLACATIAFCLVGMVGSGAAADEEKGPVLDVDARRVLLGQWLDAQAVQQRKERRFTGGSVLAVGAAGLGFGLALLAKAPNNELSKGGGVALTAAGAFGTALGIFRLVVESESEKVARRYALANRAGLNEVELARFEGEFYSASQHAHRVQLLARWLGFATVVAGVAVLIATPLADLSRGGRVAGYVSGGLLALGGGVNFASSFGTPPPIKSWAGYQRGQAPTSRSRKLFGFAPTIGKGHAGVALIWTPRAY
ncbi:MAG: hypothetical protein WBN70_17760 [Polyangiales bacterium]